MLPYCSVALQWSSSVTIALGEQQCGGVEQVRHKSSCPASAMNSLSAIKPLLFSQLQFLQGAHHSIVLNAVKGAKHLDTESALACLWQTDEKSTSDSREEEG